MGMAAGGFCVTIPEAHVMAGRFSRRIYGHGMPVVHFPAGERKHELPEEYLAKTNIARGVFLILVDSAKAPVWDVCVNHHIEPKKADALCEPLLVPHP
jgi:hypothetical protein